MASEPKKGRMDLLKITMRELISLALSADDSQGRVPQVRTEGREVKSLLYLYFFKVPAEDTELLKTGY